MGSSPVGTTERHPSAGSTPAGGPMAQLQDMTDEELVKRLVNEAARVGYERSGLVITATNSWPEMDAAKREVLRRLSDRKKTT